MASSTWPAGYRHGETLLPAIERFLGEQNLRRSRLRGIVVGTGPGAFTGLRVGHRDRQGPGPRPRPPARRGLDGGGAPRRGRGARGPTRRGSCVLLLPAGPSDRVARRAPAHAPILLRGGRSRTSRRGERLVAVDLADARPRTPSRAARPRVPGLGAALLATRAPRAWPRATADDLAALVPEYVTLPRGATPSERRGDMVARPPVRLVIEPMRLDDLPAVHAIERPASARRGRRTPTAASSRPTGWRTTWSPGSATASWRYGGMWLMVDEAHITTFAVHPAWRRQHIGERLLLAFLDLAIDRGAREATLEVRLSNLPARRLYEKFGFRPVGLRPRYYSDDNEDALIMTTEPLADPRCGTGRAAARRARRAPALDAGRRRRRAAASAADGDRSTAAVRPVSGPLVLAIESSCDETGIAARRGRPAILQQRRRLAGRPARPVGRDRARGRGPRPPALDRAGPRRGLGRCRRRLGRHRRRSPSPTARASPARCSSASTSPRRWPGSTTSRSIGVNHLEGHVYAAWLLDPGEDEAASPSRSSRSSRSSSRAATRSSSRCATT